MVSSNNGRIVPRHAANRHLHSQHQRKSGERRTAHLCDGSCCKYEKTELALDLLSDMLWHSKFDKDEIEREKGVIVEELNMYKDNPTMYVEQLFEELMYKKHRAFLGSLENLSAFSSDIFFAFIGFIGSSIACCACC